MILNCAFLLTCICPQKSIGNSIPNTTLTVNAGGLFITLNVGNMVGKTFIDKQKGTEETSQSLSITMVTPAGFEPALPA